MLISWESIAATDLNFGIIVFSLSCYTRKEFQAPLISCVGGVSMHIDHVQKLLFHINFYASLWQLPVQDRRLAVASNIVSLKKPSGKPGACMPLK